jgi:hypothetical protein
MTSDIYSEDFLEYQEICFVPFPIRLLKMARTWYEKDIIKGVRLQKETECQGLHS